MRHDYIVCENEQDVFELNETLICDMLTMFHFFLVHFLMF